MASRVDGVYRIGQASKQLGVSSYHLRRLCQAGAIEAERTVGKQWRVPISEVSRLQRGGVPPIPQVLDAVEDGDDFEAGFEAGQPSRRPERGTTDGLYATHSVEVINAAEDVAITENRLRKRRLERELEEEEDFFRGRAAQNQAQAEAERGRARKEHEQRMRRGCAERSRSRRAYNKRPQERMTPAEASQIAAKARWQRIRKQK